MKVEELIQGPTTGGNAPRSGYRDRGVLQELPVIGRNVRIAIPAPTIRQSGYGPEAVILATSTSCTSPASPETIGLTIDASVRRTGLAVRLVHENGKAAVASEPQDHLVRLLSKARSWWGELVENDLTASDLARRHGVTPSYVSRIIRLNFLALGIIETILAGEQPATLDARTLLALHDLPLDWSGQKRELHIA